MDEPSILRILIFEDNPRDVELIERAMDRGGLRFRSHRTDSRETYLAALESTNPQVVLADYQVPGFSGLAALEAARRRWPDLPFIIVTGTLDEETAVECMKHGADDYVLKDRLARLTSAVTGAVEKYLMQVERRQARAALEDGLHFLSTLVDTIPSPVFYKDRDGRYLGCNAAFSELLGQTKKEITGRTVYDIYPEEQARTFRTKDDELFADPGVQRYEADLPSADGSLRRVIFNKATFADSEGHVIGIVGVMTDITEFRQLERQLLQAQRLEAVGQLAGGVAHDFNNILQVISGHAELMLDAMRPGERSYGEVATIAKSAEKAAALTRQLLAFSRRQVLETRAVDINELVESLLKMLRRLIAENIRLEFRPGSGIEPIFADPGQIEQVLMNLCVNARDAMPEGGELVISTEATVLDKKFCEAQSWAAPGRYVRIIVTDTGQGMTENTVRQIFEPFFSTKEPGKGTGLGLAMVYGIVRQHEGMVTVDSAPGRGSSFQVCLPATAEPTMAERAALERRPTGGTETVLVAEDDENVRRLTTRILEAAGYTVLGAPDGEAAVQLFTENADRIHLAILDLVMPRLGGRHAHERIRSIRPGVRTLFTTGYNADILQMKDSLGDGLNLVRKPYRPRDLLLRVREALDE